jgi:septal ring factor EnvC (AmiA/AmiB activator)
MTNEEMERAIEFLLQHQATLEQRIEQTNEQLAKTDAQVAETNRQLAAYAETQSEFIAIVARSIQALIESQARTDERLNALIGVVERHVADGHGG